MCVSTDIYSRLYYLAGLLWLNHEIYIKCLDLQIRNIYSHKVLIMFPCSHVLTFNKSEFLLVWTFLLGHLALLGGFHSLLLCYFAINTMDKVKMLHLKSDWVAIYCLRFFYLLHLYISATGWVYIDQEVCEIFTKLYHLHCLFILIEYSAVFGTLPKSCSLLIK